MAHLTHYRFFTRFSQMERNGACCGIFKIAFPKLFSSHMLPVNMVSGWAKRSFIESFVAYEALLGRPWHLFKVRAYVHRCIGLLRIFMDNNSRNQTQIFGTPPLESKSSVRRIWQILMSAGRFHRNCRSLQYGTLAMVLALVYAAAYSRYLGTSI